MDALGRSTSNTRKTRAQGSALTAGEYKKGRQWIAVAVPFPAVDSRPASPSKATKPCQGKPDRVLEMTRSGSGLVAGRNAVTCARRRNSRYDRRDRGYGACRGTRRRAARAATGTRSRATRLRPRIARDHRKENHCCQLFHELSPKRNHKGEFVRAPTLAHPFKPLQHEPPGPFRVNTANLSLFPDLGAVGLKDTGTRES